MTCRLLFFPILILCLCLGSCRNVQEISVTRIDNFSIQKLSMKEIEGELMLTIRNPNNMGFSIYKSEMDIIFGDVALGKAKLRKRVHIGANSEKTYTFKLQSSPEKLNLADVLKLAGNAASGTVRVKGDLKFGKFFIKRRYPVDYVDRIRLGK